MNNWKRDLHQALRNAEKIASSGGAYELAKRLAGMAEPFTGSLSDDDVADLIAEVAGVNRTPEDLCIVHVPAHWLQGLRDKADIPIPSNRAALRQEQPT